MSLFNHWHKLLGNESKVDSALALIVFPFAVIMFTSMTAVIYMAGGWVPIVIGNGVFSCIIIAAILKIRKEDEE